MEGERESDVDDDRGDARASRTLMVLGVLTTLTSSCDYILLQLTCLFFFLATVTPAPLPRDESVILRAHI